jgi:geranylgeranyl diphosphate synthase type II
MRIDLPRNASLARLRSEVEQRLAALLPPADGEPVNAALHAAVLGSGKRLRPLLVLLAGRALGARPRGLLELACAVEMVHCASLVLDDLPAMDDARLRRGAPTVHMRYGEDVAMLATVALVAEACRIAASSPGLRATVRAEVVQVLCAAIGPLGLVRGQYRDLHDAKGARSPRAVAEANELKTGVLFACALELAARAAGRPDAVAPLRRAALAMGHAFQLRDDLQDQAPSAVTGKDSGQDAGKGTLVQLLGASAARRLVERQLADAVHALRAGLGRDDPLLMELLAHAFPGCPLPATDAPAAAAPLSRPRLPRPAAVLGLQA